MPITALPTDVLGLILAHLAYLGRKRAICRVKPTCRAFRNAAVAVPSGTSAVNPTSVALKRWHVAPLEAEAAPESDAATRRAILGRNRLDAELYEHAKRLSSKS